MIVLKYRDEDGSIQELPLTQGYTPIKGIDYMDEKDIADIQKYIDEHSGGGASIDLSDYYTKEEVDDKGFAKAVTLNDYTKKTDAINTLSFTSEADKVKVNYVKASGNNVDKYINPATDTSSGVMSAVDHKKLTDLVSDDEQVVTVGTGKDYTSIRECLETIKPTEKKPYRVILDSGLYNIGLLYSDTEKDSTGFVGLKVPDFCTVEGKSKDSTILIWDNSSGEYNNNISTLNFITNGGIKNLTIKSKNIRYTVHDDACLRGEHSERRVENCVLEYDTGNMACAYGAGHKGNSSWVFKDTIFIVKNCESAPRPFSVHNNTDLVEDSYIEFDNCRFESDVESERCVLLGSLNTNTTAITYVVFKGCRVNNKVRLTEESASYYGTGIKFKVSGYGNTFGNSDVSIQNTDGKDYTSYVDLI